MDWQETSGMYHPRSGSRLEEESTRELEGKAHPRYLMSVLEEMSGSRRHKWDDARMSSTHTHT
jgi:hypothetical protein